MSEFINYPAELCLHSDKAERVVIKYKNEKIHLDRDAIYFVAHFLRIHLESYNMGRIQAHYTKDRVLYSICGKYNENGIFGIPSFLYRQMKEFVYRCFSGIARKIWGLCPCKHHISFFGMKDDNDKEYKQWQQRRQAKK